MATNKLAKVKMVLSEAQVVPVIAMNDVNKSRRLASVLYASGLPCAEVTFRTANAASVIKAMREEIPSLTIGAGTVLSTDQIDLAIDVKADFLVSPGFNPEVVKYAQARGMPIIPGVNNPSHAELAMSMGLSTLKFFPAEASGGINMLKALAAVYPIDFMPTGGIHSENVSSYLQLDNVFCCGGTWMVPKDKVDNEDWQGIAELVMAVSTIG